MLRLLTRENTEADAALQAIAEQPSPPGIMEKVAATIKPPAQDDYLNAFKTIYEKNHLDKTPEELTEISNYIFGDTRKFLSGIHTDILKDITDEIAAFISNQYNNAGDNQRITSYCAAIKNKLVNSHQAQLDALEQSIQSEIKAIMSDGSITAFAEIIPKYLETRFEIILLYQQISAALYNAAVDYYRSRWEASHTNLAALKKERDAFNAIFNGIAQINEDFTLTPFDRNLGFFIKNGIDKVQTLLTSQVKLARFNKLDDKKTSFAQLIENLTLFNNEQQNPAGDFFKPVTINDKKITITFNERIHKALEVYLPHKKRFLNINSKDLDNIARSYKEARNRITESTFSVEEGSRHDLQTAKDNIELFKSFIHDEQEILSTLMKLEFQIKPADEDIHTLRTPTSKITSIGLPQNVALALIEAFNNGLLRRKLEAMDAAEKIHQKIIRLKTDTNKILSEADSTAATLQPINTIDYLEQIKRELDQIQLNIDQLLEKITGAKQEQVEAADLLEKIQLVETATSEAELYYQGLIEGNKKEDYFAAANDDEHPFAQTARAISALKSHRITKDLPLTVRGHIMQREQAFTQTHKDFSVIMRCHLLMNSLLNLKYWKSIKDKNVALIAGGKTYSIPKDIFALIEIAQQPAHQNWATDPDAANRLLTDIQFVAGDRHSNSAQVRAFLAAASQADNSPIIFDGNNTVARKMFLNPLRLVDPQEMRAIQKKPTWGEKHPIAKKVLIGLLAGFITLCVIALGIGIAMAFPPAAAFLTGLAITISSAVGGTAVFGTLCGIAGAAILGIGAGFGYLAGKISYARQQRNIKASNNPFMDAAPRNAVLPAAMLPPSKRPPMPSRSPRDLLQTDMKAARTRQPAASVSSSQFALHPPADNAGPAIVDKNYFEFQIVKEITDKYSGNIGAHDESKAMRAQFSKLWETSRHNIETFLYEVEKTHQMTAKSVITSVVNNLNKKYPGLIETYPPNSLLRRRLTTPEAAAQPLAKSAVMRRH